MRKAAFQGGLYMPRIPGLRKLDLRVEGGSTSPVDFGDCNGCFYWNVRFRNAYTNHGNLLGSWIGRASQGEQVWSTYWLSPRNTIQFNYRHRKIDGSARPRTSPLPPDQAPLPTPADPGRAPTCRSSAQGSR